MRHDTVLVNRAAFAAQRRMSSSETSEDRRFFAPSYLDAGASLLLSTRRSGSGAKNPLAHSADSPHSESAFLFFALSPTSVRRRPSPSANARVSATYRGASDAVMFFTSPAWSLVDAKLFLPEPYAAEKVATGSEDEWNSWRTARIDMANDGSTDTAKMLDRCRVANAHWFKVLNRTTLSLDKPFAVGWLIREDEEDEDERAVYTVSCAKWETLCLLARFVLLNLREWAAHADKTRHAERLRDAVACSCRALVEIKRWWEDGNRQTWKTEENTLPANIENLFETARALSEMLYELTCLARATTHQEVCAHDFNCVLMSVLEKVDEIQRRETVPDTMARFVNQTCAAVLISVGETAWTSADALRVLDPPTTVSWDHVEWLYGKARDAFREARPFFDPDKVAKANLSGKRFDDVSDCLERIAKGTFIEMDASKTMMAAPVPRIAYAFPFSP